MRRLDRLCRAIADHPRRTLAVALVLAVVASVAAREVRIDTDLVALLPADSPAADAYRVFLDRFGGLEKVFVLVIGDGLVGDGTRDERPIDLVDDAPDVVQAASRLEDVLATSPEVASVRAGFGPQDEAFLRRWVAPRAPLILPDAALPEMAAQLDAEAIERRVAELQAAIHSPAWSARGFLVRGDPLGFADRMLAARAGGLPVDPLTSTFLSADGSVAMLVLTPARSELDPEGGRALQAAIDEAADALHAELGPGLRVLAVGGPLYAAQDEARIRRDLKATISGSLIGTSLILVAAFEGLAVPLALLFPLVVALAWTAGVIGWLGLPTSAISIGFAAVLVGLGIDYALHGGARYRQAVVDGASPWRALRLVVRQSGPGIATSAVTTAGGFAVLGLAHFRPLAELGRLVPLGILSILLAAMLAGSALLVLSSRRMRRPGPMWRGLGGLVDRLLDLAQHRPRTILLGAAVVTAVAVVGLGELRLDADPGIFRPDDHPALEAEALLAEHFGLGSDTANLVIPGDDLGQALAHARAAGEALREALGPAAEISHPADLLVLGEPVAERLDRLAELPFATAAERLESELLAANLAPKAFRHGLAALEAFGRGEDPGPPPAEVWPDWVAESIVETDDGAWVAVRVRLPAGSWPDGPPAELIHRLEAIAPGCSVASASALGAELKRLATADLRTLGLMALLVVAGLVLASFRGHVGAAALALAPVTLGALWTLGLTSAFGVPIDLFGLAVLPILLGIGIDDGLHVVHGIQHGRLVESARRAGRAIVLTTATTSVGFASLLLSDLPGLRRGGVLIAAGVVACMLATLLVLPAFAELTRDRHRGDNIDSRP